MKARPRVLSGEQPSVTAVVVGDHRHVTFEGCLVRSWWSGHGCGRVKEYRDNNSVSVETLQLL